MQIRTIKSNGKHDHPSIDYVIWEKQASDSAEEEEDAAVEAIEAPNAETTSSIAAESSAKKRSHISTAGGTCIEVDKE